MRTLTLYHGTPNLDDLLRPNGWQRRLSGGSSHLDIYSIHLTRARRVAEFFAGHEFGGGVVKVEVDVDRTLTLTEEDLQRQGITLVQVGEEWRRTDGSLIDLADGWVENELTRDGCMGPEALEYTHQQIAEGRMSPTNVREIPISLLRDTYADAVIWPPTVGFPGLQHHGEAEVSVFDPARIRIVKTYPNKYSAS